MRNYYSAESVHGSETSFGFANDIVVSAWCSKKERDEYVSNSQNLSCQKIQRKQVTRYAKNYDITKNRYIKPTPFTEEFWCIADIDYTAEEIPGLVGTVCIGPDIPNIIYRFY